MSQMILNADDFGRHAFINASVRDGVERGLLRSASLMAGEPAFDEAVAIAKAHSALGVGVHFTLVDGRPVLPPADVPSLVGSDGRFRPNHMAFVRDYFLGRIRRDDIHHELTAQAQKILRAGLRPDHVDSHQHIHILPGVFSIALDVAESAGIHAVRIPAVDVGDGGFFAGGVSAIVGRLGLYTLATVARRQAHHRGFATPDHFAGLVAGAAVTEDYLVQLAGALPQDGRATEVMLHPGKADAELARLYAGGWEHSFTSEDTAILSPAVRAAFEAHALLSVNFAALPHR
ncbi:ChbG/HpnK family deacetylase [uncultured Selenomonas sp.]|uniref:ChbG/HpnK family deacetylase n=1 Tax=uncultured Selenomonas sp. TaxID=159275 RepID=UPI0025E2F91F|nr:ChbG/HpnK family deacetylase [uncultured Selenomonas sp.]